MHVSNQWRLANKKRRGAAIKGPKKFFKKQGKIQRALFLVKKTLLTNANFKRRYIMEKIFIEKLSEDRKIKK